MKFLVSRFRSAILSRGGLTSGMIANAPLLVAIVAQAALLGSLALVSLIADRQLAARQLSLVENYFAKELPYYRKDVADTAAWDEVSDAFADGSITDEMLEDDFGYSAYTFGHQRVQAVFDGSGKMTWLAEVGRTVDLGRADELCAGCDVVASAILAKYAAPGNHYMDDLFNSDVPLDERPSLPDAYPAEARLMSLRGEPVIIMGAVVSAVNVEDRRDGPRPVLVSVLHLDATYRDRFAGDLGLNKVAVVTDRAQAPGANAFPLKASVGGQTIGYLVWAYDRPSLELLFKILPLVGLFMALFTGLVAAMARWMKRLSVDQAAGEILSSHLALHDPLTGLGNRAFLAATLDEVLPNLAVENREAALLLLDLDGFKGVNDTYGHQAGDDLIRQFADRLVRAVPKGARVIRLGGDEFAVVVPDVAAVNLPELANGILALARRPFQIEDIEARIGCSIGISLAPRHAQDRSELLRKADVALYDSKTRGRNRWGVFEEALDIGARQRRATEENLRAALETGDRLALTYLPCHAIEDENLPLVGMEARLCLRQDDGTLTSARDLVRAADELGLAVELGDFVLRRACKDLAGRTDCFLSIAVSPHDIADPVYYDRVMMILDASDFPARRLEIELTDGLQHANSSVVLATLRRLKAAGVRLSIDGIGTRYAAIAQLRALPVDKVKLATTLLRGAENNADGARVVGAIAALGRSIGFVIGAEGVESESQVQFLRKLGCSFVQGTLFAPPLLAPPKAAAASPPRAA